MKKIIILIINLLIINPLIKSQVSEYYFTQQNLTYSEISGGTVLWSGTFSDEISSAVTIPSFTFNGNSYTSLYVSANGFITFGIAPAGSNVTPISSSAAYAGAISGFGRNLNQAASGSPAVTYDQVGNEFVIQWKDVRREGISGEIISFQVRLNTINNNISVVYGGTITPGSNTSYPQVGLRGASISDYNNRTIAAAGGNWINSTGGTGSSSSMYFNSANPGTIPSSGLTYIWKPLYNPANLTATAINFNEIDLAWQKNSLNHNVMLAYNTTGTFGTPVSGHLYSPGNTITGGGTVLFYGDGTSFSHTGLNPNTLYYYKIWSYDAVPDYSSGITTSKRTAYALTYLQDFNATTLPAEWTTDMSQTTSHGTAGSKGLNKRLNNGICYAISPLVGGITASTNLSFHYRIVDYTEYPLVAKNLGAGDKIDVQVSLDDGATFSTFYTIDQNNHTATTEFTNKVLSLSAYSNDFIKIKFLATWGTGDYYVDLDNVLFENGNNMSYSGSTTEQPNMTNVGIGSNDNDIIRLQIITQKSDNPLSVTSISLSTSGSTSDADIATAKIFYTTTPVFSTTTQFGITVVNPGGAFIINGNQPLVQGNNYFWVAYNIKSTATAGNFVDAQCSGFITSESGTTKNPTVSVPVGSRKIGAIISGTKSIPVDYASIAAAVTALNNGVIGSGGIIINVPADYTETGANLTLTATGTAANQIIFQKSGSGANPLVTASAGTGTADGIIEIAGGDYITFDGVNVLDPTSNTTNTTRMEWGYALVKRQSSAPVNGCQNVIIRNCAITLQKAYTSSVGIYCGNNTANSTSELTVILSSDVMKNCKIFNNTISDVYTGIRLSGYDAASPYSLYNQNSEIGVSGGNNISNFGGSGTASYGIFTTNENGIKIANNTISGGNGTTGALYGIYSGSATSVSTDIHGNTVALTGGGSTSAVYAIYNSAGSTASGNVININNNTIENNTYTTATSGLFTAITNTSTAATVNIYGNSISNNTLSGTGAFTGIDCGNPVNINIYNDTIAGNQKTGAEGFMYLIKGGASMVDCHSNTMHDNSFSASGGTAGCNIYGYYNGNDATSETIYNNDIHSFTVSGTNTGISSAICGIYSITAATTFKNIYQNNIYDFNALTGTVYGISQGLGGPVNIYKNNIYDLETLTAANTEGISTGILVSSGAAIYIFNNFISDLRSPVSISQDAVRGISVTSSQDNSNIGVYYNTIYLNASSAGADFGTSGIYHTASATATTATLDLRNNIVVNASTPGGTYYTAAFRRSASSLSNYATVSNNNIFYAGTPDTYRVLYYGGEVKQTIEDYWTYVGPVRDSASFSEYPVFINVAGAPFNLRLQDGVTSYCESGALPVTSPILVTTDFDGATRSSSPDIGADEFPGTPAYVRVMSSFTAASLNSQQINLAFTSNPSNDTVVIIYNGTGTFSSPSGTPVIGQPIAGGTVLYIGTTSPFIHGGLTPGTVVYYIAYCYNGTNYSSGKTANATPSVPPVTNFTASSSGQHEIDLSWTRNVMNHNVIISSGSDYMNGNPVNGNSYDIGDTIPSGGTVIYEGPASSFANTGLDAWTQYYYQCWSYDIYNYYSVASMSNAITDAEPVLPATATNPDPPDADSFVSLSPLLSWDPVTAGGIPSGYKVYLGTNPDPSTLVYNGPDEYFQVSPLQLLTTYYWKVIPYNSVGDAINCPVWSFTTVPAGGVQIGRDLEEYLDLPINPDYGYNYTQTIYLQSEIDIPNSSITKLYYQWNGGEQGDNYKDWVIYMGHTAKTGFTDVTDWIPVSQMTEVFNGEVSIPATEGWIEITLDTPFSYNNTDNLVIAVDENTEGYAEGGIVTFYSTYSSLYRGIKFYSDEINPDPADPPDADYIVDGFANIRLRFGTSPTTTWNGGVSSQWTNPANWTDGVPGPDQEVIIMPGTHNPQIVNTVSIKKITISSTATLVISPGGSLNVMGE